MKCLAIGDIILSATRFDAVLAKDPLFSSYHSLSWKEDLDRAEARDMVRRVETLGYQSYEVEDIYFEAVKDAEVLFIHLFPLPEKFLDCASKLKYIVCARGGVENIDLKAAKARGISIIHCPAHNAVAVAEYTIALILCEMRNIARANLSLKEGVWRERFPNSAAIPEMNDATIGIVGFGTIGQIVARYASAFESRVLVSDPYVPEEQIKAAGYKPANMEELLAQADVVTLHGRIAAGAPPIIGEKELDIMKETAYLINTARAALVDMEALRHALEEKKIMGAAIDVFPKEPIPEGEPFLKLDNVTLTNHRGGDTLNSYAKAPMLLMEQLRELLETGKTRFLIS